MKRIVITGSAGVGKTTLIDALFDTVGTGRDLSTYIKIEEVARKLCQERGYKNIYEITEDVHKFRFDVLHEQIRLENEAEKFIVDRSTIDAWAYFMRWSWNTVTVEETERFYNLAKTQAEKYDLIIFIPIMSQTVKNDGFRWANLSYQIQMERLLKSIIAEWGLTNKTHTLRSTELSDRANELTTLIGKDIIHC